MKLPLSWLSEFVSLPKSITVEEIAEAFVKVGFEVEGIDNPAANVKGPLLVGKVLEIEELTGLKKPIRFVTLDCGEKKTRQVICGARNFEIGDHVVVAIPGAVLPGNFAISSRETYGRMSNGMICSARELGLGDDHSGIIVLNQVKAKIGTDAMEALGMNDPIIDIAVNPDRGYAMSIRGAARELALSLGKPFKDIESKKIIASLEKRKKKGKLVPAQIADPTGADAIYLRTLRDFNPEAKSPEFISQRLTKAGMRSISLAVDVTNYVMLELGQPLHAFDADLIDGALRVQRAGKFTSLTTLDNQKRKLNKDDLLIADAKKPLALAGTMGGLDSEVTAKTVSIALEAAHFNPVSVARNSRRHILSSEASRRFERGVDPLLAEVASARAAALLIEFGGATYVGTSSKVVKPKVKTLTFDPGAISTLIGETYSSIEIDKALRAIGGKISKSGKKWVLTPPTWRTDLTHVADLAEEVARYYGYDRIPSTLPRIPAPHISRSGLTYLQKRRRALSLKLAHLGLVEVHNYPFVSAQQMSLFGFTGDRAKTFEIANPMSEEFPYLRTHLTPGLISAAARNLSRGEKSVALFESGLVFRDAEKLTAAGDIPTSKKPTPAQMKKIYESVPKQALHIGGVIAGEIELSGWWGRGRKVEWSDAVDITRELVEECGSSFTIKNVELAPWHPGRCAEFVVDGRPVAHAGELHPRITSALGLPERTVAFVLIVDALPLAPQTSARSVVSLPAAIQDISLFVPKSVTAGEVEAALREGAGELLESITLFDRFEPEGDENISLAFTMVFRSSNRTLTSEEVSTLRDQAGAVAAKRCGATVRR